MRSFSDDGDIVVRVNQYLCMTGEGSLGEEGIVNAYSLDVERKFWVASKWSQEEVNQGRFHGRVTGHEV